MAKVKTATSTNTKKMRPALTPEARQDQMICLAEDLAERQLREGTASSQLITHYLKLGTAQARLELKKLEAEIELQKAKTKAYDNAEETKVLIEAALKAMKTYSGNGGSDEDEEFYDEY